MDLFRRKLIHLHASPFVTRALLRKIIKDDSKLNRIHLYTPHQMAERFQIKMEHSRALFDYLRDPNIMKKLDMIFQNITCITIFDDSYPSLLKSIPDPPIVLYLLGNTQLLNVPSSLSVVGTRTPSIYAFPSMKKILNPLINQGFMLVSGFAKGIDQYAHNLAVQQAGKTIAVLGSGFQHIYPKNNPALLQELCYHHLLVSEYPPDRQAKKYHFPERNRIISGLSQGTLVVEARMRSGSLITVDQALEQGREVYAMPSSILNPASEGCHYLIQQGAKLVQSSQDILEDWKFKI
ncbi:DNA-processing protein DprA [Halobacillus rhizosphaerae]|uniref:DNA-processing protein DprA n=1 Tax=Halobacillus rhizosphaerae TaxID=3064889 RepID=UPI00398B934A